MVTLPSAIQSFLFWFGSLLVFLGEGLKKKFPKVYLPEEDRIEFIKLCRVVSLLSLRDLHPNYAGMECEDPKFKQMFLDSIWNKIKMLKGMHIGELRIRDVEILKQVIFTHILYNPSFQTFEFFDFKPLIEMINWHIQGISELTYDPPLNSMWSEYCQKMQLYSFNVHMNKVQKEYHQCVVDALNSQKKTQKKLQTAQKNIKQNKVSHSFMISSIVIGILCMVGVHFV